MCAPDDLLEREKGQKSDDIVRKAGKEEEEKKKRKEKERKRKRNGLEYIDAPSHGAT